MEQFKRSVKRFFKHIRRFFQNVARGDRTSILILAGIVAVILLVVVVCVLLNMHNAPAQSQTPSTSVSVSESESYDKSAATIAVEEYDGVILSETEDAGEEYIDETLFIGDSNTARMTMFGPVTLQNSLGASSMGIQHVTSSACMYFQGYASPVTVPKAVSMMQPRRIIINYGTNNTAWDAETFVESYRSAIEAIRAEYEYADIIIAAVHPVAKSRSYPSITMQRIDEFNKALVDLAEELDCSFLNSTEALKGSDGYAKAEYMETDGIHLNKTGMAAYMEYVRTHASDAPDARPSKPTNVPKHNATPDDFFGPAVPEPGSSSSSSSSSSDLSKYTFKLSGVSELTAGEAAQFNAKDYAPSYEEYIAKMGSTVAWTTSDPSVATVDANGRVTALKAGSATITCKIGSGSASMTVKVTAASSSSSSAACTHPADQLKKETITAPTCTATGQAKVTCGVCGKQLPNESIPALGHAWGEWKVTTAATCGAAGVQTRVCTREGCGATETAEIPATGAHTWVDAGDGANHKCSVCGATAAHTGNPCTVCGYTAPVEPPTTGGDGTGSTTTEGASGSTAQTGGAATP